MLSRTPCAWAVTAVVLLAVATSWTAVPAFADSGVTCPPKLQFCYVDAGTPGSTGSDPATGTGGPSNGSTRECAVPATGETIPCYDPSWGWWDEASSCYWRLLDPQPPDSVTWQGHYPDGAIYEVFCLPFYPRSVNGGWAWRATPPPGYGGTTATPAQLAQQAVDRMALTGPAVRTSIPFGRFGTVGVPVWLWTEVSPSTWGPNSATASVPGLSVTARAQARQIVWDTGDGASETCQNPGTAYVTGAVTSPTCQHIYARSSAGQPGQAFELSATTTWDVTWSGGGASGELTVTRTSQASVRIGEVQVLVTNG